MKTDNLPAELRTLMQQFPNDSRVCEMLSDAAAHIEQLETPYPPYAGGEITNAQLEHYLEACEKNWCQVLHIGWDRELARLLLAAREQLRIANLPIGEAAERFVISVPKDLHSDTKQLVIDTAHAMAAKLFKAQEKYGFTNGWKEEDDDSWNQEECLAYLYQHLAKGDPLDCINYLAFMLAKGWETKLPTPKGWVPCSPEWIEAGGDCASAPRVVVGALGNHYHPAPGTIVSLNQSGNVPRGIDSWPPDWRREGFNHCMREAARALRYLAENPRPIGGESFPNAACCHQIAGELEKTIAALAPVQVISAESFDKVQQLLEEPAAPSQALVDLMTRPRRAILVGGQQPGKATLLERARLLEQEAAELARRVSGEDLRERVRADHAEWAAATFGDTGPVGPLKHLSREALEAAEAPGDLSEWADMQFLFWDAQRKAGVTDEQITKAMVEKLEVNKARQWPEPKEGEPRFHIKGQ